MPSSLTTSQRPAGSRQDADHRAAIYDRIKTERLREVQSASDDELARGLAELVGATSRG